MGLRPADRYPQLFINATLSLPEGGISGVVRSGAGFHILKVVEKRQAGMPGVSVTLLAALAAEGFDALAARMTEAATPMLVAPDEPITAEPAEASADA